MDFSSANPWVHAFAPLRERYVSPAGGADGTQESKPMSLAEAILTARAGDRYWFLEGTYNGEYVLSRAGTGTNPIVWRARTGHHALINGRVNITGAHNWIWGLEITDPGGIGTTDALLRTVAAGFHAINNVIHDGLSTNNLAVWNTGSEHVVYGNILYNPGLSVTKKHNIYTQNDYTLYGYKYFVNNVMADATLENSFNFHAYTEGGLITGMHCEKNIIKDGRFLIGGYNLPADNEVVKDNYFYQATPTFGYRRPTQVEFQDNYIARGSIVAPWFWGAGETTYPQNAPNVFVGNEVHLPATDHVAFRTSAFWESGRVEGIPAIQPTDVWDYNTYSPAFQASFYADSNNLSAANFSAWRSASSAAGNPFDAHSLVVAAPTANKVVVLPNEYEEHRAHLAIYNWSGAATMSVDLAAVLDKGMPFTVHSYDAIFGSPVVAGIYNGPVSIRTAGKEFTVFLVRNAPLPAGRPILAAADFNGDGGDDIAVWRGTNPSSFRVRNISIVFYGMNGDVPVTGDYNGDAVADYALWRPSTAKWWFRGGAGPTANLVFGQAGDIPIPADYDGDFRTDTAVWRPANGYWAIKSQTRFYYGVRIDVPIPGDYNGDGRADAAVFRPSVSGGVWYIRNISQRAWGLTGDIPVPGDYNGDGTTELSVFRGYYSRWYVLGSPSVTFGQNGDIPVVIDYEGDGTSDRVLYRPSEGNWYIYGVTTINYGVATDVPAVGKTY
jgi:hypothetical protein